MPGWNFGDLLERCEAALPDDALALGHGEGDVTWGAYGRRTRRLARALTGLGAAPGDKVAFYLRNDTTYLELLGACFKARLVHVNVNYRYLDDELVHILDDSDAKAVVFHGDFAERVEAVRGRLPGVAAWVQAGGTPAPWAVAYEPLAAEGDDAPLDVTRSGDDMLFVYTGGTTGMPKGVMWTHEALWGALGYGRNAPCNRRHAPASPEAHAANVAAHGPGPVQIPACPLMHGTGLFTAVGNLVAGGALVTLVGERFDPAALFDTVERRRASSVVIVGDAFAKPMLQALEADPGRWDLSSLKVVISSGVMWSDAVKRGILRHHPDVLLADMFGSSEAIGFGSSVSSARAGTPTARFRIGEHCKVFTEDHREVVPGSGERGFVARSGPIPSGYYKDPEKTARTFPVIDGVRYAIPGDWCTVEADGTLTLLGRGSACINTAGEKVHAEEVEEALKTHPQVEDALVFGLPDARWGQAVTAVVRLRNGAEVDGEAVRAHTRARLAGYKVPKRLLVTDRAFRAPNGKADYKAAAAWATSVVDDTTRPQAAAPAGKFAPDPGP